MEPKMTTFGGMTLNSNQIQSKKTSTDRNGNTIYHVTFNNNVEIEYPEQPKPKQGGYPAQADSYMVKQMEMVNIFGIYEITEHTRTDLYNCDGVEYSGTIKDDVLTLGGCKNCTGDISWTAHWYQPFVKLWSNERDYFRDSNEGQTGNVIKHDSGEDEAPAPIVLEYIKID